MPTARLAAWVFVALLLVLTAFQFALVFGAPWGRFAMGGMSPGTYPPAMRVAALAQVLIYGIEAAIVVSRAGLGLPRLRAVSSCAIWVVVGLGAIAFVLNAISPSSGERMLWTPVALVLLLASLRVAFGKA